MTRSTLIRRAIGGLLAIALVVGGVIAARAALERLDTDDVDAPPAEPTTAAVEIRDLTEELEAVGTLGYTESVVVASPAAGTVTELVEAGTEVSPGDAIAVLDETTPIVWLPGEIPMYRDLVEGTEGADVEQLESALVSLGFDPDGEVEVDEEYTDETTAMVEAWQASNGASTTGSVRLGTVVFGTDLSRVASTAVEVGDGVAAGSPLVGLGDGGRVATFSVDPGDAVTLSEGDLVDIELPGRVSAEGRVERIEPGLDAWSVEVGFDDPSELPTLDVVEVTMSWTDVVVAEAVTVPSSSLLRRDDGSYVVDVVDGDVLDRRVVSLGPAVGTLVVIEAGLAPGDVVVVI